MVFKNMLQSVDDMDLHIEELEDDLQRDDILCNTFDGLVNNIINNETPSHKSIFTLISESVVQDEEKSS